MSRGFVAAVMAACVAFAPCALVLESAQAEPVTVKSSKSNTSDRTGGGAGAGGVARTTTVKSSKSNTSDRMGGGGGRGSGALDKTIDLNNSRSNSNY